MARTVPLWRASNKAADTRRRRRLQRQGHRRPHRQQRRGDVDQEQQLDNVGREVPLLVVSDPALDGVSRYYHPGDEARRPQR